METNRRYPAEWETQKATWLSYPHNENEWGKDRIEKIRDFYKELIDKILDFQEINLIFPNEELLKQTDLNKFEKKKFKLNKFLIPNNDIWIRDYGPFFMQKEFNGITNPLLLDFGFNAWGGKFPPWDLDDKLPQEMAKQFKYNLECHEMILEGGSLEFSGDGLILTTEQCLLNKNRNPHLNKSQIEETLKSTFNIEEIIWLKRGLEGDHTDGHIDDVARFISPKKVIICKTKDKNDENYNHLNESINYLKNWSHPSKGYKLEVIELPMPDKMEIKSERLPNSYANFIFVNGGIILPAFNCPNDKKAESIFKSVFSDREIVSIDCTLLIEEGGGIHCMSKQEPLID